MQPISPSDISDGVLALSDDLGTKLTRALSRAHTTQMSQLAGHLKAGRFEEAKTIARELEFTDILAKQSKTIQKFTRSTALLGAGAVDKPSTSIMANGAGFPFEVDKSAVRLMTGMIDKGITKTARKRILAQINRAERFQKAADPLDPDELANKINRFLRGEIKRVVNVSSNIVGTRVSGYGMLYEARVRGISRYRIDAIRDDATTDICIHLDGRTFEVEQAYVRAGTLLSITDPDQQKKAAPFPNLDEIGALSNAELQERGIDTPPFHFLCRTVITMVDTKKEYDPVQWSNFPETAKDAANALKLAKPVHEKAALDLFGYDNADDLFMAAMKAYPEDGDIGHVSAYTGNMFNGINERLRLNRPWEVGSDLPATAKAMDTLIARTRVSEVTYSYRGISAVEANKMKVGKIFQDDGFISTSLDPRVAADFVTSSKTILQIQIGEGAPILPAFPASLTPAEFEMILPRGAQFRVLGRATQQVNGEAVTVIRVVYQGVGKVLPVNRIGLDDLPDASSVVKAEPGHSGKFVYDSGDLKEAVMNG